MITTLMLMLLLLLSGGGPNPTTSTLPLLHNTTPLLKLASAQQQTAVAPNLLNPWMLDLRDRLATDPEKRKEYDDEDEMDLENPPETEPIDVDEEGAEELFVGIPRELWTPIYTNRMMPVVAAEEPQQEAVTKLSSDDDDDETVDETTTTDNNNNYYNDLVLRRTVEETTTTDNNNNNYNDLVPVVLGGDDEYEYEYYYPMDVVGEKTMNAAVLLVPEDVAEEETNDALLVPEEDVAEEETNDVLSTTIKLVGVPRRVFPQGGVRGLLSAVSTTSTDDDDDDETVETTTTTTDYSNYGYEFDYINYDDLAPGGDDEYEYEYYYPTDVAEEETNAAVLLVPEEDVAEEETNAVLLVGVPRRDVQVG